MQRATEIFAECLKESYGSNTEISSDQVELQSHSALSLKRQIKNQDTDKKLKTKAMPLSPSVLEVSSEEGDS